MENLLPGAEALLVHPITWIVFIFGAVVGSFLNVCIHRIPTKTFFKEARSHCPHCGKQIPFWYNIPILSWILLRGKAACCGAKISVEYLVVELLTASLFVLLYWQHPFLVDWRGFVVDPPELIRFLHLVIFSCLLLVASVIDIHLQIIPDVLSLPMIAVSPLVVLVHPELTFWSSALGVLAGGGSLYLVAWLYYLVRREAGIGMGDVKLLAAIGGWLGYQSLVPTVFLASITGALFGLTAMILMRNMNLKSAVPFGPFLSLGAFLYLVWGQQIAEWLLGG